MAEDNSNYPEKAGNWSREVSDLEHRVRNLADKRPYVAVLSALAAGFVLARFAARLR